MNANALTAADWRCLRRLCLFLLAAYLLTMSGRIASGDGETMYQTTKALVTRGRLAIEPRPETAIGRNGQSYSKYGLAQSAVQAPFFAAGHALGKLFGATDDRPARFGAAMVNAFVTAALIGLFWLLLRELGNGRGAATGAALVSGLCTLIWPYAKADFAEPLQALTLLLALYCLMRWRRRGALRWAAAAGAAAGTALLTKVASLVLLPALAVYFLMALWQRYGAERRKTRPEERRRGLSSLVFRPLIAAAIPFAVCVLFQAGLNYYRFGKVTEFGYGNEPATGFTTPLLEGTHHLLLSPGKGLLLFAPPVVLGLAALPWLARRQALTAAVVALVFVSELLYYGRWWAWHGDWCWGPRYMYVSVPFLMLGWGAFLSARRGPALWLRLLSGLLAGAGLYVAFLGVAIDYGAYYSVVGPQLGRGVDVREARLVPEFSPLLGHAWLAQASLYDRAMDLSGHRQDGGAKGQTTSTTDNPYLQQYPWRMAFPQAQPEAPQRALGFDFWFVTSRDRTPLVTYWSALVAAWLTLALVPLGLRLRAAAQVADPVSLPRHVASTPRTVEVAPV